MSDDIEPAIRTFPKSVQPGIPYLRPAKAGWRRVTFGEVLFPVIRPVKMSDTDEYRLVTVKRSRGGIEERGRLKGRQISVKAQFELQGGDFLISKRQIVHGACAVVSADFAGSIVSNEYSVLRCTPDLDLNFLGYLAHSIYFQQTCFHSSIGVHVEKMIFKLGEWFEWPVNLPSLPEQQKMASFLGAVDGKISGLRRKEAALVRFKAGLMQKLFSQKLRFTRDDGSEFPDWKTCKLEDIVERKNSGLTQNEIEDLTGPYPVYAASGIIGRSAKFHIEEPYVGVLKDGAGAGRIALFPGRSSAISTFDCLVPNRYVGAVFLKELMENIDLLSYRSGSTIPHIYFSQYKQELVGLPCDDEQQRIADFISVMSAKISSVRSQISKMETFKKGLLQQMFV